VDDINFFAATGELKEQTTNVLKTEFKVNHMGELNWLLRIQISCTKHGITQTQRTLFNKILNCDLMQDCKLVSTAIDVKHRLRAIEVEEHGTYTTAYYNGTAACVVSRGW
jgi:hypothetical protein